MDIRQVTAYSHDLDPCNVHLLVPFSTCHWVYLYAHTPSFQCNNVMQSTICFICWSLVEYWLPQTIYSSQIIHNSLPVTCFSSPLILCPICWVHLQLDAWYFDHLISYKLSSFAYTMIWSLSIFKLALYWPFFPVDGLLSVFLCHTQGNKMAQSGCFFFCLTSSFFSFAN
jgi:hypothetical protein